MCRHQGCQILPLVTSEALTSRSCFWFTFWCFQSPRMSEPPGTIQDESFNLCLFVTILEILLSYKIYIQWVWSVQCFYYNESPYLWNKLNHDKLITEKIPVLKLTNLCLVMSSFLIIVFIWSLFSVTWTMLIEHVQCLFINKYLLRTYYTLSTTLGSNDDLYLSKLQPEGPKSAHPLFL